MVVTLWARLPLLEPPFVLSNGKSWPSYGPTLVQLKSDVMKLTYYIQDQNLAMFNPFPQRGGGPNRPPHLENAIYSTVYLGK